MRPVAHPSRRAHGRAPQDEGITRRAAAHFFTLRCGKKVADCAPRRISEATDMSSQIMPSDLDLRSSRADEALALDEDTRLRNDIRLLGRILGDTVRDQE